jgi:hypothetical protein
MSAAELRQAAETLRTRAEDATPGRWQAVGRSVRIHNQSVGLCYREQGGAIDKDQCQKDARYIASVDPEVGDALADLLDAIAKRTDEVCDATPTVAFGERVCEQSLSGYNEALAVARLVNSGLAWKP